MGFSRQEGCSGLPFLSLGDLPDPGIKPGSPEFQADSLPTEPLGKPSFMYIPSFLDFLATQVSKEHRVEIPAVYSRTPLIIYFIHGINSVGTSQVVQW